MIKKFIVVFVATFLLVPAVASSQSQFGIEPTRGQLLSRIAALQAILSGAPINCALATSKSTVKVGEVFTIAWGSFGADSKYSTDPSNSYTENGEQDLAISTPEIRTYQFTFFGPNGSKKTCEQTITVTR